MRTTCLPCPAGPPSQACDELAQQMEQPFQHMPLDDIANTYERDINRQAGRARQAWAGAPH